jgi:two-component system, OmpR family, sensor kinase
VTLSARLSAFFLAALAVVLAGFSITLYLLAQSYLYQQLEERLAAALDTLTAAVELEADGIDWEPHERRLTLGEDAGPDQVRWLVRDGNGRVIDRSANLASDDPLAAALERPDREADADGQSWRLVERRLRADDRAPGGLQMPLAATKHSAVTLDLAIAQTPVRAVLARLAATLTVLSAALWGLAALVGRRLCGRALAPVSAMAAKARSMDAARCDERLPSPGTCDELEELGRAFNDLLDRLQEAFERQRRFTGDASHQLRTPLTALLGQIDVILRRDRAPGEYRDVLAVVHRQAMQLRHIVEMLLFLARADGETRLPNLETVDLSSWLPEYLERWSDHSRARDLHYQAAVGGPQRVRVQLPLLAQLLDNLLDNACKYSLAGTPIRLRLEREGEGVACTVEDAGCGIAAADLPRVFEPFFRSADARARGFTGVGLGLSVAQRIAAAFAGRIEAQSPAAGQQGTTQGPGSRFTLWLPLAPHPGPDSGPAAPARELTQVGLDGGLSNNLAGNAGLVHQNGL